jgi:hypothetical protein
VRWERLGARSVVCEVESDPSIQTDQEIAQELGRDAYTIAAHHGYGAHSAVSPYETKSVWQFRCAFAARQSGAGQALLDGIFAPFPLKQRDVAALTILTNHLVIDDFGCLDLPCPFW